MPTISITQEDANDINYILYGLWIETENTRTSLFKTFAPKLVNFILDGKLGWERNLDIKDFGYHHYEQGT